MSQGIPTRAMPPLRPQINRLPTHIFIFFLNSIEKNIYNRNEEQKIAQIYWLLTDFRYRGVLLAVAPLPRKIHGQIGNQQRVAPLVMAGFTPTNVHLLASLALLTLLNLAHSRYGVAP